ncbi:MAG: type II toxin-antitoxin system VapC family toxin [Azonexaceae bacterium]|nr:type II toxin-antitoxin system VapC family toxin [Azonexaceae bacterium]
MFRKFRILILLLVLATVGLGAWRSNTRLTAWEHTIHVAIYPIAGDSSPATAKYISGLNNESFMDIAHWMQQQTEKHGLAILQPVALRVAPPLAEMPPLRPSQPGALDAMLWSLKLRWWASQHDKIDGPKPHVRLFVLFHDPDLKSSVPHSTGLSKGQIGVIHAYASRLQRRQNAVVIAHEMLHTFGASDKYDLATLQPIYPQGYAEPGRNPRLPQVMAEIMGGRVPIDEQSAEIPIGLADTLIGPATAQEIGLTRSTGKNGQN